MKRAPPVVNVSVFAQLRKQKYSCYPSRRRFKSASAERKGFVYKMLSVTSCLAKRAFRLADLTSKRLKATSTASLPPLGSVNPDGASHEELYELSVAKVSPSENYCRRTPATSYTILAATLLGSHCVRLFGVELAFHASNGLRYETRHFQVVQ